MSFSLKKEEIVVSGIKVNVFSNTNISEQGHPVAILFFLHGRQGSASDLDSLVSNIFEHIASYGSSDTELLVDHRNHGTRLVDAIGNKDWKENNEKHAIDMYAIQVGTASDVSTLIDFLPSYLFPNDERKIHEWLLSGISLGGHSTWIALKNDPRIRIGIPIIGCPDYLALICPRASDSGYPINPPYFPVALVNYIKKKDPASVNTTSLDSFENPYIGKRILVLSGGVDKVVPWVASQNFVDKLQVGSSGIKKVVLEETAGHECTSLMIKELAGFIWQHALKKDP
ncbi:hypothetical protein Clacol_002876 [Clathrus columnatus]|uniref:Alpha/beta-hydrolase n=1 Tax=Clathrus columnatus TaxID=1419009 RepID=A0AAV5A200_9AGAM|nr:hypothetical protein Clacol_002876 [Clathrus columnatus]